MSLTTSTPRLKATTLKMRLLRAYRTASTKGFTAEEAAQQADIALTTGYWKRVSELAAAGYIVRTGKTRIGTSGRVQAVLRITAEGRAALKAASK